ncbi:MAG: ATP-binding protein [Gemmataceae bacterium]
MNAETLKRLIRAISDGSRDDLDRLARKVIQTKRDAGQNRLADELEAVLNRPAEPRPEPEPTRGFRELPVSRRQREQLATLVPRGELEHSMVLPPEVEARFARIEREFAARERLGVFGLKPSKKVLLYGPPGCGKSLGAKRLAWNTGLPLMKVRFDALLSSYFGESLANLRAVFDAAKDQPCVLLLDECDFIARSRSGNKDIGEASRIVNMLLQLMDDYEAPGLLVATTNLQDSLDAALFRRFDEVFRLPLPGVAEIDRLIRLTLAGVNVSSRIDWPTVSEAFVGLSAAQVVKLAQNAAKSVVLANQKTVEEQHLREALAEARLGPTE